MSEQNSHIELSKPTVVNLQETVNALRSWQQDGEVIQLHPGDLGWYSRFGQEPLINAIRQWIRSDKIVVVGLLDGDDLIRLAIDPSLKDDLEIAEQVAQDISSPDAGVLGAGGACVEARLGNLLRTKLQEQGWELGDAWASLKLDLSQPIDDSGLRIEIVGPDKVDIRVAVQRSAFINSTFTEENWHNMATSPLYKDARCLLAYDELDNPVATATVWSAGMDRPGLIEPLGVDPRFRGKGHGTAITLAAAAVLREMGASSATVCTDGSNIPAVATYKSAGFVELPEIKDLER